jgi:hypothetical protein
MSILYRVWNVVMLETLLPLHTLGFVFDERHVRYRL